MFTPLRGPRPSGPGGEPLSGISLRAAAPADAGDAPARGLARLGIGLADWSQRWFPDAFVFALLAILIVFVAGLFLGTPVANLIRYFGEGFWSLIPFTLQMAVIIIGSYVVAISPPVYRLIRWLSGIPRTPRAAVAFVAFFSMVTALISWGLSLIFSGILAREVVQKVARLDYRAVGAAAYLGTGSIWALGFSSSAALMMATPSSLPAGLLKISGAIPLRQTIGTWQSVATALILAISAITVAYFSAPASSAKTAESFGVIQGLEIPRLEKRSTPGEWLEYAPWLSIPSPRWALLIWRKFLWPAVRSRPSISTPTICSSSWSDYCCIGAHVRSFGR